MLRIARLTDRTGRYYLDDLASELGASDLRAPGRPGEGRVGWWSGEGAAGLDLSGPVAEHHLAAVLSGRHPHADHPLRRYGTTVAGYDLVFAAPKSVSVLFALGATEPASTVLEAHREAVEAAMAYVAGRAAGVRAGSGEDRRTEPVRGLVAARFDHGVSRALDPHLHSHVVVANMGQDPGGRWRALDGRGVHVHARAAGALYDAHLRHALTERSGAGWVRRRSGACELASVDPILIGALSARQAEIRERLHHLAAADGHAPARARSGRAGSMAWAATRDDKRPESDRTPEALRHRWAERAAAVGWSAAEIDRSLTELGPPTVRATLDEHRFAASLHDGTQHAGAARRDVVAAWAESLAGGAPAPEVERCVDALAPWGSGVGVAEPARPRAELVPSSRSSRALGPRPATAGALAVWLDAARSVDRAHRRATDLGDLAPVGGGRRSDLARLDIRQLAAHLAADRAVADARRRLGLSRIPVQREADRSLGRG